MDFFDHIDDGRPIDEDLDPNEDDLLALLRQIERKQAELATIRKSLSVIVRNPLLSRIWRKFTSSGGITADDFARFREGRLRPRIVHGRRHLRLIQQS